MEQAVGDEAAQMQGGLRGSAPKSDPIAEEGEHDAEEAQDPETRYQMDAYDQEEGWGCSFCKLKTKIL